MPPIQIKKQLTSGTLTPEQHATLVHQLDEIYEQRRRRGTNDRENPPRHDPPLPPNQTETISMQWQASDQSMRSFGPSVNRLTQPTPPVHKPDFPVRRSNHVHDPRPVRSGRGGPPPPPPRQSGPPRSRRYRPSRPRGDWGEEPPAAKRHPWPHDDRHPSGERFPPDDRLLSGERFSSEERFPPSTERLPQERFPPERFPLAERWLPSTEGPAPERWLPPGEGPPSDRWLPPGEGPPSDRWLPPGEGPPSERWLPPGEGPPSERWLPPGEGPPPMECVPERFLGPPLPPPQPQQGELCYCLSSCYLHTKNVISSVWAVCSFGSTGYKIWGHGVQGIGMG